MKKGQVTLFILLGVLLVILVLLLFYLAKDLENPFSTKKTIIFSNLEGNIRNCITTAALDGVYSNGVRGGYYPVEGKTLQFLGDKIPYFIYNNNTKVPAADSVGSSLGKYIEDNFYDCLQLDELKEQNFSIKTKEANADISIKKQITVKINTGITASKDSITATFDDYEEVIDFNYLNILNTVNTIVEASRNQVPMGLLTDLSKENNFKFEIIMLNNNTAIYSLYYYNLTQKEEPYRFSFLAEYDWK